MNTTMERRRFGKTGLAMPVLTCGGMRHQFAWSDCRPEAIPREARDNFEATTLRAWEIGIDHFETARGYGTSEMQFGWVLPQLPRDRIIVQTKVAAKPTAREFLDDFETSMRYLKLDYLDLLAVHGVNNPELIDFCTRKGGTLEACRQLQRDGRVRHIGFSTHAPPRTMVQAIQTDAFDFVNLHWYYVYHPMNWPAVAEAARRDMGVMVISPNDKGGKLYAPPQKLVDLCRPLSPMVFNGLFCLARPEVQSLSIGPSRPSDWDEPLRVLELYDQRRHWASTIARRLDDEMKAVLGEEWFTRWDEGLPEWEATPGRVHIREILRLWNYAKGLDMVEFGKTRYNLLGNGGHWFPGENAAQIGELDLTAALANSPFAGRIPRMLAEAHELLHDQPVTRQSEQG
jgi:predicted aldo/keto reductase-like oxidoreductase